MEVGHIFEKIALGVEAAAIAVIVVGIIVATIRYIYKLLRKHNAIFTGVGNHSWAAGGG